MERTPPGDDKKPGVEPKKKELPLPLVAEGQVPAVDHNVVVYTERRSPLVILGFGLAFRSL